MRKNFVYTQTRLQARHGMRPDERTWGLIESQKDLSSYLQSARTSSLSPWISGLQATDSHHFIESTLLKHYRNYVEQVAAWVPAEWRKSVQWIVCLTYLPVLDHLIKGNTGYNWMLDDAKIKLATTTDQEHRIAHLLQSEFASLFKHLSKDRSLVDAWLQHWRFLWPDKKQTSRQSLNKFVDIIEQHRDYFSQLPVDRTWSQRQKLVFKMTMLFRRQAYNPVNVFVHLLLIALDVERIRGGIIQRCLFPDYREMTV